MSRGFGTIVGGGSSDLITASYNKTQSVPISVGIWVYKNSSSAIIPITQLVSNASGWCFQNTGSNNARVLLGVSGNNQGIAFTDKGENVWQHWAFTFDGTLMTIYVNGLSAAAEGSVTMTVNTTNILIGALSAGSQTWSGYLAHAAYWNGALLSAGEMLALGSGISPMLIRPDCLSLYMPLDGVSNPEPDLINGASSSITGTRLGTSDPPVQPFSRIRRLFDYETDKITAASSVVFRRTLSMDGSRVGSRQSQAA